MHRDISVGNILIRVTIERDADKILIIWRGTLSDWELAKPRWYTCVKPSERMVSKYLISYDLLTD